MSYWLCPCLARTVVAPKARPVQERRWTVLTDPIVCRERHRPFVRTKGGQKRCRDCCQNGIGGPVYRDGKRINKRDAGEVWGAASNETCPEVLDVYREVG